jgi:hypothetical protein
MQYRAEMDAGEVSFPVLAFGDNDESSSMPKLAAIGVKVPIFRDIALFSAVEPYDFNAPLIATVGKDS